MKQNYYNLILNNYRHDIRKTWGVIKSLIGRTNDKTGLSDTFKINNTSINDPQIIANEFCIFFTNVGINYANNIPASKYTFDKYMGNKSTQNIYLAPTDPYEISRIINSFKRKHSSGHDMV